MPNTSFIVLVLLTRFIRIKKHLLKTIKQTCQFVIFLFRDFAFLLVLKFNDKLQIFKLIHSIGLLKAELILNERT